MAIPTTRPLELKAVITTAHETPVIAIPSHRRADVLKDNTLKYLSDAETKFPVYIFLSDEKDLKSYQKLITLYQNLTIFIIYPEQGMHPPFNSLTEKQEYIHYYFQKGTQVVVMEDDIECWVRTPTKDATKEKPYYGFDKTVTRLFEACNEVGTVIWGINPSSNGFYHSRTITDTFKLIVGFTWGFISTHDKRLTSELVHKNDYERSAKHFLVYGKLIRANYIGAKTKSFSQAGGMNGEVGAAEMKQLLVERAKKEIATNKMLIERYPHFFEQNTKADRIVKGMYTEIKCKRVKNDRDWEQFQIMHERTHPPTLWETYN